MRAREEKILFQGDWLSIKRATYRSVHGAIIDWEVVERSRSEAVIILLARLVPSGRYILLRQFRAGINGYVIALPAGIVRPEDDLIRQAHNELKEETGYTGKIVSRSPLLKINPAMLDCDVVVFEMEIDENAPENAVPRQELEPEEEIEVILVEKNRVRDFLVKEEAGGTAIDVACWFSFGI
jgi:ADP-ribose pyrophosphatase